jgi:beta-glucosidase/6-phospho-beta-glucosidase/beta-galactosidase
LFVAASGGYKGERCGVIAVFSSFFLAGFESATGYNAHCQWFDQIAATEHDQRADEDYRLLSAAGIRAAREAVRWPVVDVGGRYDFSSVLPPINAARQHGIELIFDLFHFGYPADVDLFAAEFSARFADYAYAAARFLAAHTDGPVYITPINEPSYFAWAAGEAALFAPHARERGWELKVCLMRGAIQGIEAIRAACPDARIINVDSLCRVVAPFDRPDLQHEADDFNNGAVMQGWDMLAGRLMPELGGSPQHLDIIGLNYYWTNQWELHRAGLPLDDADPRRWSLSQLVRAVSERYRGTDILLTETSHVEDMRPVWLRELAGECELLLREGVPLRGVCLYPALGMPEWHSRDVWTRMGLWDLQPADGGLARVPHEPTLAALGEAQLRLEPLHARGNQRRAAFASAA